MITLEEVVQKSGLHPSRIHNVYVFGSRIYGTASDKSDYDVLVIANTPYPEKELVNMAKKDLSSRRKLTYHVLTVIMLYWVAGL